jgi:hypothetical protein
MELFATKMRFGPAEVFSTANGISAEVWRQCFSSHCKDQRYYQLLEHTLRGQFLFRYLLLRNENTGAEIVQPLLLVKKDMTVGLPRRIRPANRKDSQTSAELPKTHHFDGWLCSR